MGELKAIIFDVDGVLIYSENANVVFFQTVLVRAGYKKPSREAVLACSHMTALQTLEQLISSKDQGKIKQLMLLFRDRSLYNLELLEFPLSLEKTLETLHRTYRLAIVSGRIKSGVDDVFKVRDIGHLFDVVVGSDEYHNPKPHPEPLQIALKRLHLLPQEAIYVGDSPTDIIAAQAADMKSIHIALKSHEAATIGIRHFDKLIPAINRLDTDI